MNEFDANVFKYEKDSDGIVTITMDMNGPVNAMNAEYSHAMAATVDRLENESDITGVVFASAKKTFFAGGDLNWLLEIQPGEEEAFFNRIETEKGWLRRLEKLPVPVVAAINGAALGGGFEICLSCNHRIAWNNKSVIVGLPEVTLGLLSGAGGVVRMTNLLGLEKALPWVLEGKKVNTTKALSAGIIHETVDCLDGLLPRAKAWILENKTNEVAAQQPWDREGFKIPGGNLNQPAVTNVAKFATYQLMQKTRGLLPAPERILESAVEAARVDFDTALRVETRKFSSLVSSPVAKNLISTFFFDMNKVNGGASRPKGIDPTTVKKVGVLGAGMMGQGISLVSAQAGIEVVLKDVTLEAAEKGKAYSAKVMDKAITRGRADEAQKTAVLGLITATDRDEDLAGCDLIVEAVFENMELKHNLTRDFEGQLAEGGVWGSNTSTLPITQLAQAANKPDNFIGIHFFSPVDKMPLVELICGEQTSDETLAKAFDYVRTIRKTPIVVNDSVGFFTSRTFMSQLLEAAQMVAEGVDPIRIDNLGKAIGMPVGPITINDEISQQLLILIDETQTEMGLKKPADETRPEAMALLNTLVKEYDRCGRHHGGGYYNYSDGCKQIWPKLNELYGNPEVNVSDEDIKDRLLFSNVIESLKCLEEGVLRTVADGNVGSVLGIGAPTWTGGYIQFVNTYGLQRFIDRCDELAGLYGERFKAPAIVAEKLAAGETFH
jgi:3-hydroxyacyl-CoA dehydrogenase/enoyl-CoA hydratase/3-hydroxybutyryl-CoA epimerase